ncbi:hypothetical protein UFOVP810_30 [uncultured Caudovirales phage]|uniref:Uncharacterized protein n=1 Tax=uncultured Caudovirales phage TaxID=2100421 RepID=A0A6J5NX13_9CAUD|nr:hypothetical protein UFOVP810_30 [uncultured Caudovirales phage]
MPNIMQQFENSVLSYTDCVLALPHPECVAAYRAATRALNTLNRICIEFSKTQRS